MRYILAIVCSLICCMVVAQQPLPLRFEHITTNNGLSNNTVLSINQDHDGFMWFGTEDGLNKYDGSNFKTYRHKEKDSLSLAGNNIADIVQDRYNPSRMWVSSHCSGLSNFNPYDGRSIKYTENENGSTQLKSNCEIAVLYDNDGNTWVKNRRSLSLFNKQNNTFKTVFTDDSSIIYSFVVQGDNIWMGLGTCVKTYNTKTGQVVKYHLSKDGISQAFYSPRLVTATGEIICGSWQLGMCIFNPQTKSKKYFFDNAIVNSITEITILNRKQLWVASNHDLFVADIANGYASLNEKSFTCYLPNITDPYTISSKNTTTIFQDRNGIIWVGTSDNGINKLVPNYLNFQQRQMFSSNNLWNTFANETPLDALIEQENGKTVYWFNYWYGGGLMKADENFQVIDRISFKHELPEWQKENRSLIVSKILRYGKDTLCLATWDGLWLYNDKQKKLLYNYKLNDSDSTQPKKSKFTYIIKDKQGDIWLGTFNQQTHRLNIATGKWKHYKEGKAPANPQYAGTGFMLLDKKDRLWFSRFYYYDFKSAQFVHSNQKGDARSMLQDSKGTIWAVSDLGLMRYNESTKSFDTYTVDDGLKSNRVNNLVEDNDGNIWATTPLGLVCYNTNTYAIKTFSTADGLPINDAGDFLLKLPNGNLMFHLVGNAIKKRPFIIFNPRELLKVNNELPFHFTNINILGKEKGFEHSLDSLKQLDIDYKENLVNISFKALEFASNYNIRYRYKLNNNTWTELGSKDNITFTNLRGGKYLLQVQATDAAGNWMNRTLQMNLVVHPPFWQTGWFIVLVLLLIAAISTYFVRRRISSIKAKALVQQQLAELEMKALKAQMNPHFVFNSLSSIQESIVHGKTEAAAKYLGKFSKLIRMVLMQSDTKTIALQDELDYLNLYLELESFRFEDLVAYNIDSNGISDIAFIRIPSMLIQPYLENAIKHGLSHKQGSKHLQLRFEDTVDNMLIVTIEDNGIGRKQSAIINQNREASHVSMGMKITDERLLLLKERNAKVHVEDLVDASNNAVGTRVTLSIPIDN